MQRRLLIADDNVTVRKHMQQLLQDQGYEVLSVGNGELAVAKTYEFQPHMILLDVIMPGKTGYEVCEFIKHDPSLSQIPVILTFSENEPFDPSEARRVGATRCLPKSIETEQLISILDFIWAGVTPIEYSNVSVSISNDDDEGDDSMVEMEFDPVSIEVESISSDEYEEVEAIESDESGEAENNGNAYQFEVALDDAGNDNQADDRAVVAEQLSEPQPLPVIQIRAENSEVEIPGLEPPARKIVASYESSNSTEASGNGQSDSYDQVLDSPITGDHFKYVPPPESPDDPLQINDSLTSSSCRECGARVIDGDVFCIECGAAIEEAMIQSREDLSCDQCGESINQGDVFCLNCGAVQ